MSFRRRRNLRDVSRLMRLLRQFAVARVLLRRNNKIDEYKKKIPNSLKLEFGILNILNFLFYNSNAFLGFPPQSNSTGFSKASLTATKKPTDSRPSIILWS